MKKYIYSTLLALLTVIFLPGCVQDLKVESIDPNTSSTIERQQLFIKIYSTLALTGQKGPDGSGDVAGVDEGTSSFYRMTHELQEFPSDQIYWIWPDVGVNDIRNMSWTASNTLVKGLYARLYFDITLCNLYLDQYTEGATQEEIAEVRFIRALNYWYLLDMFGNVPFVEHSGLTDLPEQIERPDLYVWLKDELINNIVPNLAPANQRISYYRVDQAAAWLLLSRMCLNAAIYGVDRNGVQHITDLQKEYTDAAYYADQVIKSGYELASKYEYLFMGDNDNLGTANDAYKEIILPIGQDGEATRSWGGSMYLIASCTTGGMPSVGITENWKCIRSRAQLVALFCGSKYQAPIAAAITTKADAEKAYGEFFGTATEIKAAAHDERALFCNYSEDASNKYCCQFWKTNKSDEFVSGWGITKFKNSNVDPNRTNNDTKYPDMDVPLMRKAEAYLNYAEAVLRGGTQCGMSPDEAVNTVRRRAGAEEKTGWNITDKPLKGLNILDERGRELYCEGIRRTDLIRFGYFTGSSAETGYRWEWKGGELLGINADPEDFRILYPLPLSEVTANHNLEQNPGYEVN